MDNFEILPLTVEMTGIFFISSRDSLERASINRTDLYPQGSTDFNLSPHRRKETQASIESIVFSFLVIESTVNVHFIATSKGSTQKSSDRWLHQKWKSFSIYDRFFLLVNHYATADLNNYQYLTALLREFINFRNRIVHAMPEQYSALIETIENKEDVLIHDVEPILERGSFPTSGLTGELGRITHVDAMRAFEIMLLICCFLDEQLGSGREEFSWIESTGREKYMRLREIINSLEMRFYPKINPDSFIPECVRKFRDKNHV